MIWIGPDEPAAAAPGQRPAYWLRREFDVAESGRATLRFSARGMVEVFVNGSRVGDELLPGYMQYEYRLPVRTYDVTYHVRRGHQRHRHRPGRRMVPRSDRRLAGGGPMGRLDLGVGRGRHRRTHRRVDGCELAQGTVAHRARRPDRRPGRGSSPLRSSGDVAGVRRQLVGPGRGRRRAGRRARRLRRAARPSRRRARPGCSITEPRTGRLRGRLRPEHQRLDPAVEPRTRGDRDHLDARRVAGSRR